MNGRTEPAQSDTDATARPPLVRELLLVVGLFLVYKFGRRLATGHTGEAFRNADRVWDLERAVHLPGEGSVQHLLLHGDTLIHVANTYYATVHFPATAAFLIWLYLRRPAHYVWARRVLAVVTAAALVAHLAFPLAPPRMLAATGLIDTGQVYGPSVYGSPETDHLSNQFAAMPSLHFGWALQPAAAHGDHGRTRRRQARAGSPGRGIRTRGSGPMNATLLAVLLSLFSAAAYAAAAVAQERLASRAPGTGVLQLVGSGAWWGSVLLNCSGALLHVVALKYGPLTVVQPLGALTLVAAVPLVEWRGTALTLVGLAAILVTASGHAPDEVLSTSEALAVAAVTVTLIGMLSRPGARPGLRHATASGFASGVGSALTQTVTVAAADHSAPLLSLQVAGVALLVAALAASGLLLSQTAYRDGLGAPLAVVTLANPLAAAVIGLVLLGERLQGGAAGILLAPAGAVLASWGVVLLSRARPQSAATDSPGPDITPAADPDVTHCHGTDDEHPVAAVLALQPGLAAQEPALMPRQPRPGHLTPL